jgi:hypothetical protein
MKKRGRQLFLVLASLIVFNEATNLLLVITTGSSISTWLRSMCFPLVILWAVWNVWNSGDRGSRFTLGGLLIAKSLIAMWVFGFLMISMAKITPSNEARFFWEISAFLFALPALQAIVFIAIGLTICYSRSIRAFLETRKDRQNAFESSP